ncbi:MAG: sulfotransferase family 2 domain-containing protein [Gammaproteobacteria bacterium]|nr:sulfotransferase family 2 domain-containing protein [Gammaproteobacteria bacterium]
MPTVVSHQKQFVFIHINKAGGTSISSLVGKYEEWPFVKRLFRAYERRYLPRKYKTFSCCGQHFVGNHASARMVRNVLGAELFDQYYKFAAVRNPWDREVSRYFYARKTPTHGLHEMANQLEFAEFIKRRSDRAIGREVSSYQFKKVSDEKGNLIVDTIIHIETWPRKWHRCSPGSASTPRFMLSSSIAPATGPTRITTTMNRSSWCGTSRATTLRISAIASSGASLHFSPPSCYGRR